jgi:hypothetical protein
MVMQVMVRLSEEKKVAFQVKCAQESVKMQAVLEQAVDTFLLKSGQQAEKPRHEGDG